MQADSDDIRQKTRDDLAPVRGQLALSSRASADFAPIWAQTPRPSGHPAIPRTGCFGRPARHKAVRRQNAEQRRDVGQLEIRTAWLGVHGWPGWPGWPGLAARLPGCLACCLLCSWRARRLWKRRGCREEEQRSQGGRKKDMRASSFVAAPAELTRQSATAAAMFVQAPS